MNKKKLTPYIAALEHGYKSGLEDKVAEQLKALGFEPNYEKLKLYYIIPESTHSYRPDFIPRRAVLEPSFIYQFKSPRILVIETKGRFLLEDRKKHILLKQQYPNLDLRFVFTNSKTPIRKGSKTTYGMWCNKEGFKYADKLIPKEWLNE